MKFSHTPTWPRLAIALALIAGASTMPAHATNLLVTVDPATGASKFLILSGVAQSPSSTADSSSTTIHPSDIRIYPSHASMLDSAASPSSPPATASLSWEELLQQSPKVMQAALTALQAIQAENRSTLEQQAFIPQLVDALRNSGVVVTETASSQALTAQEADAQKKKLELLKAQAAQKANDQAEDLKKKLAQAKAQATAAPHPPSNTTAAASNVAPQPTTAGSTNSPAPATAATSATVLNLQQLAGLIDHAKPSSLEGENATLSVTAERARLDDPSGGVTHSGALRGQQEELEQAKAQTTAATQPTNNTAAAASNAAPQSTSTAADSTATPATFQDLTRQPGPTELLGYAAGNDAAPSAPLTRAEVATTAQRGMNLYLPTPPGTPTFADTPSTSPLNDAVIAAGAIAAANSAAATSKAPSNTPGAPSFTPLPDLPSRESLAQLAAALVAGHGTGPQSLPALPNGALPDLGADDVQQLLLNQHMQSPGFQAILAGSPSIPDTPPVEEQPPIEELPPIIEDLPPTEEFPPYVEDRPPVEELDRPIDKPL